MNEDKEPGESRRELTDRQLLLLGLFAAVCGLWAFWPTICRVTATWAGDSDYSHGYLVVPFVVLFLWLRRSTRPAAQPGFHPAGLLLLVASGLMRHVAARLYLPEFDAWSIPFWIAGVSWTLLGWPILRWSLPPIAFLWFATPLPATVDTLIRIPLQQLAAQGSGIALQLFGLPAVVEGTTILLGDQTLEVERACSGLRMFYGITAVAFATILIAQPSRWKSICILAAVAPVAILVNVLRITASGLFATYAPGSAAQRLTHDLSGLVAIPVAVMLFAGLLWLADRVSRSWRDDPRRTWGWLLGTIAVCLVLAPALFWWYLVQRERAVTTLVETARRYEALGDLPMAAKYLGRYHLARPDDTSQLVRWAETYAKAATTLSAKLRAAELLKAAYQADPQRRDLALRSIDLSVETQSYRAALELIDELQAPNNGPDDVLVAKRADVLLRYLNSPQGSRQSNYTWADVSTALEAAIALPEYSTQLAAALAVVTREYLTDPAEEERATVADALINRLVAERATDPEAWYARYCYAKQYWAEDDARRANPDGDLDEAVRLRSAAVPGRQVEILLAASNRSRRARQFDAARKFLEQAIEAQPVDARPYLALADVERQSGDAADPQAGIDVLRRGLKATDGRSIELTLSLAQALAEFGDEAEAERVLQPVRAMQEQSGNEPLRKYVSIGLATTESIRQARRGRPADAARTLQAALESSEDALAVAGDGTSQIEGAWRRLGQLYSSLGRHDQAMEAYRQVLRINPESPTDRQMLAETALLSGDVSLAIEENLGRVKREPESGDAWVALAIAQLQQQLELPPANRDLSVVSRSLSRAWKFTASPLPLLLASVDQLRAQSRWKEAQQLLEKSLQENPDQPRLWQALAVVQLDQSDHSAALQTAQHFAAHGGSELDVAALEASILVAAGRGPAAVERLNKARTQLEGRDQLRASQMLATLHWQLGNSAEARAILESAHQANPEELGPVEQLVRHAADDRDWSQLALWEGKLRDLEGDDGTLWKAYRVIRLLADDQQQLDREQLAEMGRLVQQITAARPRWAMSQYLLAQVAVRRGENDEAIRYLERTWQLGDHGASVAVQLFSLLVEAGRKGDANRYIAQLGDLPLVSPGLFDRVMPLFFQTGRSNQAVARARKWVEESPQDAQAYVRLGRTLLLYASTQSNEDEKAKQLAASESAFRDALRLSPDDISTWTSLFAFLLQTQRPLEAAELLEKFARDAKSGPVEKELLLARLYGAIPRPALAVMHWRRAVRQVSEQTDHAKKSAALSQAATYFAAVSPPLAERYCRQALELDGSAPGPTMLLADLLSTRADPKALDESITLAERASRLPGPSAVAAQLLWARLLTQRNGPGDANQVIILLESQPIKDNDEKLLLASNYSRIGRQGAAYELFDDVASTATPRVGDLAAYLEFWQENFQADGRFTNRVQEVLDRFGELSQGLPEQLRWMIRLAQTAGGENTTSRQPISSILAEFWASPRVAKLLADDRSSQSLLYGVLYVLLDQGHVDEAVELCRRPPGKTSPAFAARLLANTIMGHRLDDAAQVSAGEKLLDDSIAANPNDLLLLQDAGDLAALSGHAARAEAMYQRVLAIDPSHSSATGNLVALLSGDPARRHESLQIVDEALVERPSDATLLNAKGQVLLSMDRVREAIATLVEAAQQDPLNASVYLRLARAHDQLGEESEAEEALLITSAMGIDQQPLPSAEQQALAELRKKYKL